MQLLSQMLTSRFDYEDEEAVICRSIFTNRGSTVLKDNSAKVRYTYTVYFQ